MRLKKRNPKEVEEIGGVDPYVVETACLAHDLGHPPFGHTGEEELNRLAESADGFEGNAQSFRIVTQLAFKSLDYPGLDLTRASLAAILKYPWFRGKNRKKKKKWGAYRTEKEDFAFARPRQSGLGKLTPSAEAMLMDWADDVTYSVHDVEDFYRAGRIPMHLLCRFQDSRERQCFFDDVFERHKGERDFYSRKELEEAFEGLLWHWRIYEPYSGTSEQRTRLRYFTAKLIHNYIDAVGLDVSKREVTIQPNYKKEVAILKELTWTYVIEAPSMAAQREGQKEVICKLFEVYANAAQSLKKWGIFPPYYKDRIRKATSANRRTRIVTDLIAGMTEQQAIETYRIFTGAKHSAPLEEIVR